VRGDVGELLELGVGAGQFLGAALQLLLGPAALGDVIVDLQNGQGGDVFQAPFQV